MNSRLLILIFIFTGIISFWETEAAEVTTVSSIKPVAENNLGNTGKNTELNNGIYSQIEKKIETTESSIKLFGTEYLNSKYKKSRTTAVAIDVAVGKEYVLSEGDYISIMVSGDSINLLMQADTNFKNYADVVISKNGTIAIPRFGSFMASGKSISEVESEIHDSVSRKYKDIKVDIALLRLKNITVSIIGEVIEPGNYSLQQSTTVVNAIYEAGGITETASLRNVKILKKNKDEAVDVYEYLLNGKKPANYVLAEGDTIFVPYISRKVSIIGNVLKPAVYELKDENNIGDVLKLSGGITEKADVNNIKITRVSQGKIKIISVKESINEKIESGDLIEVGEVKGTEKESVTVLGNVYNQGKIGITGKITLGRLIELAGGLREKTYSEKVDIIRETKYGEYEKYTVKIDDNFEIASGDKVFIYNIMDINENPTATIVGEVNRPNSYNIYKNTKIYDMIIMAEGLKHDKAFYKRVDVFRTNRDGTSNVYHADIAKIRANPDEDIEIEPNDIIKVYSIDNVTVKRKIYINGEVKSPGEYTFYDNMTLDDVSFYAKGFTTAAMTDKIEVVRNSDIQKGYERVYIDFDKSRDFQLRESDQIFVRKKENWEDIRMITISGYVKHPGQYSVQKNETLNDIIKKAGFKEEAFPEGIKYKRKESLIKGLENLTMDKSVSYTDSDTSVITNLAFDRTMMEYTENLFLKDGDEIYIPEKQMLIKVVGEVFTPGMISYKAGEEIKYYLDSTGGLKTEADEEKIFIQKYNGKTVKRDSGKLIPEPGDTVVIPKLLTKKPTIWETLGTVLDWAVKILTAVKLGKEIGAY